VTVNSGNDRGHGSDVRLLHWNVHSWRDQCGKPNMDAVAGLIAEYAPDVVSLVEVNEPWAAPAALPEVARRAGYAWVFVPVVELGTNGPARGYGNALLSRLAVHAVQQWQLTWPPTIYDGTEPSEPRTVTLIRAELPSGPIWTGSTHLPSTDRRARSAALQRLVAVTQGLDAPWLICGDFNVAAEEWISAGQPIVVGPDPAQSTHPADDPVRAIDYCIASPNVSLAARALRADGSDHLPVLVDCRVSATRGPSSGEVRDDRR
jgi:endonuclease/exonuclease/phosphatase family metal-dependent hydrolase